jgi:hypothetical protein
VAVAVAVCTAEAVLAASMAQPEHPPRVHISEGRYFLRAGQWSQSREQLWVTVQVPRRLETFDLEEPSGHQPPDRAGKLIVRQIDRNPTLSFARVEVLECGGLSITPCHERHRDGRSVDHHIGMGSPRSPDGTSSVHQGLLLQIRIKPPMALETELATYRSKLPDLKDKEGKFVLIHGTDIIDFFSAYDDAIKAGYEKFKLEPFLVKQVQTIEQVQFISRFVDPCAPSA